MQTRSAIGRFEVVIIVAILAVVTIGIVGYYDPVTNPPTFSHTFRTSINYSGGWKMFDAVYYSVGKPPPGSVNYSEGSGLGNGSPNGYGTLIVSGPDPGWTLCIVGEKQDSSNATLMVGLDGMTNETSLPYGHATVCESVFP